MATLIQQLLNGISAGAIYALIALGYTLVYGVLGLINFAHGEVFMMAAYAGYFAAIGLGYTALASSSFGVLQASAVLLASMACAVVLGVLIERFAYHPLRNAGRLAPLITAIGVSILLQSVALLAFGSNPRSFPRILPETRYVLSGVVITNTKIVVISVALFLMFVLHSWVHHTWMGKAIRAVSVSPVTSQLMGIHVDAIIARTFALGSALAAVGGVLFGLDQIKIDPTMGTLIGLKAFVASVVGGIGHIRGALVGGLMLGLGEQLTAGYISADYRDAITFILLILILLFRPAGLLGKPTAEKV